MDDYLTCPMCGALNEPDECELGKLGSHTHYRCRECGMVFNDGGGLVHDEDGAEEFAR